MAWSVSGVLVKCFVSVETSVLPFWRALVVGLIELVDAWLDADLTFVDGIGDSAGLVPEGAACGPKVGLSWRASGWRELLIAEEAVDGRETLSLARRWTRSCGGEAVPALRALLETSEELSARGFSISIVFTFSKRCVDELTSITVRQTESRSLLANCCTSFTTAFGSRKPCSLTLRSWLLHVVTQVPLLSDHNRSHHFYEAVSVLGIAPLLGVRAEIGPNVKRPWEVEGASHRFL